jgi:hypothetical protein
VFPTGLNFERRTQKGLNLFELILICKEKLTGRVLSKQLDEKDWSHAEWFGKWTPGARNRNQVCLLERVHRRLVIFYPVETVQSTSKIRTQQKCQYMFFTLNNVQIL